MITVEDLSQEHVAKASMTIRVEDQSEWIAGIGCDVVSSLLRFGWKHGMAALREDGEILCMWGVEPDGYVWLVATDIAEASSLSLHRVLHREINRLTRISPSLYCWSDSRNTTHHRWLEWCGFRLVEERGWGLLGIPFKHYRKEANVPTSGHTGRDSIGLFSDAVLRAN